LNESNSRFKCLIVKHKASLGVSTRESAFAFEERVRNRFT